MAFSKDSKATLVIDSDALLSLSKPINDESLSAQARSEGRTFLDIINSLSQRDDIEQIVVTDAAIWEIMGQIDGQQIDRTIVREGNARNPSFVRLQSFVDDISIIDTDGVVTKEGKYPKIHLQKTSSNEEFEAIREKAAQYMQGEIGREEFWKFAKTKEVEFGGELKSVKRRNLGENVSEAYMTQEYQGDGEMFFLSGDSHARAAISERCTREAVPIGGMNIMGFISATLTKSMKKELGIDPSYTEVEAKSDLEVADSKRELQGKRFELMGVRDKRGSDERATSGRNFTEFVHKIDNSADRASLKPEVSDRTSWVGRAKPVDDDPRRERGAEIFER